MKQRPLTAVACSWIVGSGLSAFCDGPTFWLLASGLTLFCPLTVVASRISWKRMTLLWFIFAVGAAYWSYNDSRNISKLSGSIQQNDASNIHVTGTMVSPVQIDGDRVNFILRLKEEGEKISVQVKLAALDEKETAATWRRGDVMEMQGSIERPGTPRNFGAFDYRNYLRNQRIHWVMKVSGAGKIHRLPNEREFFSMASFFGKIDGMRAQLGQMIEQLFPGWQGGYMKGLLIGLDDDLEPDKYDQFTRLGLTHILAISGSHVAINVSLLFGLMRLCRVNKQTSLMIVFCCVPVYVLLTGFSPSVIRSGIMTMLGLYLMRRGLLKDGMNVLSAAALIMLVWDPYLLLNVSFQLSFSVTAGLILFVPLIMPYLGWLPQKLRSGMAITLAAQFVSFPLTIYYFNQFSLLSLAANMIIVPVIGLIVLPLGTAALLLGGLWMTLGQWMAYPVELLNSATFFLTEWLDGHSGFMTYWKSPSLIWMILYFVFLYLLLKMEWQKDKERKINGSNTLTDDETAPLQGRAEQQRHSKYRTNFASLASLMLVIMLIGMLWIGYRPANEPGLGHVQFIDVGQGDCALITTPSGKNIIVDGGGTATFQKKGEDWRNRKSPYEVGAKTLVPLLKQRGIHRIHIVIATHGDQDHIGGLQAVLDHFPVDSLLINGSLAESDTMRKLMQTAIAKHIPVYAPYKGMKLQPDDDTLLHFLSPQSNMSRDGVPVIKEQNHWSVVFLLKMNGTAFLFTGDMDESAELGVLGNDELTGEISSVDVMKVAHHGSKTSTSSEWLHRWRPRVSVISVSSSNTYGHPNPNVLERLIQAGSTIYRSDLHGEVQMQIMDGKILARYKNP